MDPIKKRTFLIFILSFMLFSLGFYHREFIQFESRFGLFAEEMLRNGWSFFPTVYQHYYPDYPATMTIFIAMLSHMTGTMNALIGVLPTAFTSALSIALLYRLASDYSQTWAVASVLFCISCLSYLVAARSISLDQFVTLATLLAVYLQHRNPAVAWPWLLICCELGFLFRGPIGFIIPMAVIASHYAIEKEYKRLLAFGFTSMLVLAISFGGLLSIAYLIGGNSFLHEVLRMQALGRIMIQAHEPSYNFLIKAFYYYAPTLPMALVVICLLTKTLLKENTAEYRLLRHLVLWAVIVLLGMTIPSTRKLRYLLPMVPAIALLASYPFARSAQPWLRLQILWSRFYILVLCLSLIIAWVSFFLGLPKSWVLNQHFLWASIGLTLISINCYWLYRYKKVTNRLLYLGHGVLGLILIIVLIVQPVIYFNNQVLPFVKRVEAMRKPGWELIFYKIGPDAEDIKYMVALNQPITPLFFAKPEELQAFSQPALYISKLAEFSHLLRIFKGKLPLCILLIDRLGHEVCVVFIK